MEQEDYFQKTLMRLSREGVGRHNLYKFFLPSCVKNTAAYAIYGTNFSSKEKTEEDNVKIRLLAAYFSQRWLEIKD